MKRQLSNPWLSVVPALLLLFIMAGSAGAITFDLTAEAIELTMPDGILVPAWGYRLSSEPAGSATVPGPVLEVPDGDTILIVNLTNLLAEPTSLHILGQTMTDPGPPAYVDGRVMSFVKETAPNATLAYQWDDLKPGTYLLQSATNPAKQVQMGLFAAVIHDAAPGQAYNGVSYDDDRILVFHEIDPNMQMDIAADTYLSSVYRHPRYFLINGAGYPDTSLADVGVGQTVLLRFVNAGLETHVPQILNKYLTLVAQDGIRRGYDQEAYGFELNAAATMDALVQIDAGDPGISLPIYDARVKHLSNAGAAPGGMLVKLNVGAGTPADTVTILRTRFNSANSQLRVWATSNDPNAVLTVDGYPAADLTTTDFTDANVLNGEFSRIYVANITANPGTATVSSTSGGSASATVAFTADPQAFNDAFATDQDVALTVAAAGLLSNDLKGGWLINSNALRAIQQTGPANGTVTLNPDGSFLYTPDPGFSGQDGFSYVAEAYNTTNGNPLSTSAPATVTIYVNPTTTNAAPTATDDQYNGVEGATLNIPAPGVLSNDSDPENSPLTAVLSAGPAAGTLTFNTDGSFTFDGPAGTHTFTYVANDGAADSAPATVTISINDLPVAGNDAYSTDENVTLNVAAPGVLANDSDTNPAGGALSATLAGNAGQGILTFNADGSFTYVPGFNFSGMDTFTYTVTDALGAVSAPATVSLTVNNTADTVTITRLRWRNGQTRVRILATSSAPAGSVTMTALANFSDGNPAQNLGTLNYNANAGEYRATLRFDTGRGLPVSITVSSSQGGSDTQPIPFN